MALWCHTFLLASAELVLLDSRCCYYYCSHYFNNISYCITKELPQTTSIINSHSFKVIL